MEIDLLSWPAYFDNQGRLLDEYKLRKTSFFYGLSDNIRSEAWPFLLSVWDRDSTSLNRHHARDKMLKEYEHLRNGWINAQPELFDNEMKQSIKTIGKDVRRTERQHPYFSNDDSEGLRMLRRILITLSVYDTEVAYVQGMNEIVAPILLTLQEESLTFWCFVKLLPLLRDRLLTLDISPQLSSTADLVQYFDNELYLHIENLTGGHWLFCFRWYLLMFKNEFKTADIMRLWDVMFSQHNTGHFEIFVGTSIILMHKEQVLACGTSDQLLHFAQSVTAKLDVNIVINYSRDLSVKIANTEGLSDNLAALVKQVDKVPPPLVGFVRRRQQFKDVYSGRQHMNDDLIKSLMKLNTSQTAQTTPLFFNCTESPIPIPTQNYLSGIQGVKPLTLAEAPELAPPPTDMAGVGVTGTPGLRSRQRRPDALYKDSVGALASQPAHSAQSAHSVQGQYQGQVAAQQSYNSADYSSGVQYGSSGQYHNFTQFDNAVQYNTQYVGVYNYDSYTDYQYQYGYDTNYSQENHAPSHSLVYTDVQTAYQTPENSFNLHDHTTPHHQSSHAELFTSNVTKTEPSDTVIEENKGETSQLESSQLDDALSKINDDFWGMGISVHTDDALS